MPHQGILQGIAGFQPLTPLDEPGVSAPIDPNRIAVPQAPAVNSGREGIMAIISRQTGPGMAIPRHRPGNEKMSFPQSEPFVKQRPLPSTSPPAENRPIVSTPSPSPINERGIIQNMLRQRGGTSDILRLLFSTTDNSGESPGFS